MEHGIASAARNLAAYLRRNRLHHLLPGAATCPWDIGKCLGCEPPDVIMRAMQIKTLTGEGQALRKAL